MSTPAPWLDWRHHKIGKRPGRCRLCGRPAWMRDGTGRPCHKVCAEGEARQRAVRASTAYATRAVA